MILGKKHLPYFSKKRDIFYYTFAISIILILVGSFFYRYEERSIKQSKYNEIQTVAKLKSKQISDWYYDEVEDSKIISQNESLVLLVQRFMSNKNDFSKNELQKNIDEIIAEHNYQTIFLTDLDGKLILPEDKTIEFADSLFY